MSSNKRLITFALLIMGMMLPAMAYAQFGEAAGPLVFNVTLGGQQTLNMTLINEGSQPASFQMVLPSLNTIPNTTAPTIAASPMNGTLAPGSQYNVRITVSLPSANNRPGLYWHGIIQVLFASSNATTTNGGSAAVQEGLAKAVQIQALAMPEVQNATSAPVSASSEPYGTVAGLVVAAIIVVVAAYCVAAMRKSGKRTVSTNKKTKKRE
jgi:hypothetical protein